MRWRSAAARQVNKPGWAAKLAVAKRGEEGRD